MHVVITGVAGFIGSRLAQLCLARGDTVLGCDSLTSYYDPAIKKDNLARLGSYDNIEVRIDDLRAALTLDDLAAADVVFHQAGQPGVRSSWNAGFAEYVDRNIMATQWLIESCVRATQDNIVVASSSSVYGNARRYPVTETDEPRPYSPYGVTKLAAERLALAYAENHNLCVSALRYFTVYGPGQRPDMATQRLVSCAIRGDTFELYGDGSQQRDFTYVDDVVMANLSAAMHPVRGGRTYNICGGSTISMSELVRCVERAIGREVPISRRPAVAGDVTRTEGCAKRAHNELGWQPAFNIEEGVGRQVAAALAVSIR